MTKTKILITIALVFAHNIIIAQKVSVPKDSLCKLLCQTWKIDYSFSNGKKTERSNIPKVQLYELSFHPNYTFEIIGAGQTTTGSWCYNETKKDIELELRGENVLRIFSINKTEFILTFKNDSKRNSSNLPENFTHFSPK